MKKYGYVCAVLTFAIVMGACSEQPTGVTWAVDPTTGKPVTGSEQHVYGSDGVELRRQELFTGVASSGDCGGDTNAYEGEHVVFRGAGYTGDCTWIWSGSNQAMGVGLDHFEVIRFWPSNQSMNNNARSFKARGSSTQNTRVAWHLNEQGGGGVMCEISSLAPGALGTCNDPFNPPQVSSLAMCKGCQ